MKLALNQTDIYKNTQSQEFTVGDDIESKAIQFKLVMEKLYANPLRASIREIVANAVDANKETGNSLIKVDMPSPASPNTVWVSDFGPGISPERMQSHYLKVFSSTKRDSDDEIGSYGIGRLSCLSLAEQYPLITTVDGTEYHYAVFLNERGIPDCALLATYNTNSPNGTSVGIPVPEEKFWKTDDCVVEALVYTEAEVTVSDEKIQKRIEQKRQSERFRNDTFSFYFNGEQSFQVIAEIGGVPYQIQPFIQERIKPVFQEDNAGRLVAGLHAFNDTAAMSLDKANVVLHLPIGGVDLSTSRESIQQTERSRKVIEDCLEDVSQQLPDVLTQVAKGCDSFEELLSLINDETSVSSSKSLISELAEKKDLSVLGFSLLPGNIFDAGGHGQRLFSESPERILPAAVSFRPEHLPFEDIHISASSNPKVPVSRSGRIQKISNQSVVFNLGTLMQTRIVFHEASKRGSRKFYEKQLGPILENTDLLIFRTGNLPENLSEAFPSLFYLQELGLQIDIIRSEAQERSKPNKQSRKGNPGNYIRPVKIDGVPTAWNNLFRPEPLGYVPETGLYVVNNDDRDTVRDFLDACNQDERNNIFFVRDSYIQSLPKGWQAYDAFLKQRRESRTKLENDILSFTQWESGRERFAKLRDVFRNNLQARAITFLDNLEELSRHFRQESKLEIYDGPNEAWRRPRNRGDFVNRLDLPLFLFGNYSNRFRMIIDYTLKCTRPEFIEELAKD